MDIAIIKKAISGDSEAFEKLYQSTHDKGFSVAYSVLKDSYEAEDVLQDSYIKMYEKLESLQNPAQFESWFYTIIRNKALDYLRSTKKDSHPDLFSAYESDENTDFIFEDTLVSDYREFNPEANVDYTETKRIIADIIEGLPEMQRQCIILRFQKDMKISEIAELLDLPESTVKSNLNYGKKKIEAEVKALEKQGVRLYSVTPLLIIPFLRWMWGNKVPVQLTESAMEVSKATGFAGSSSAGGSSSSHGAASSTHHAGTSVDTGAAANVGSANHASVSKGTHAAKHIKPGAGSPAAAGKHTAVAGKAVAAKGAVAATGAAAKTGGTILAAKIMAAVAAVSLIGGVAVMTIGNSDKDKSTDASNVSYVQSEIAQANSAHQNTLPITDEVVLTEEFLKGNWILNPYHTKADVNTLFGSMFSLSAPFMTFGANGEFSYGIGADGGVGSFQIADGQIEYAITTYNGGYSDTSTLQLEIIDGEPCIIQHFPWFAQAGEPDYIVWSRENGPGTALPSTPQLDNSSVPSEAKELVLTEDLLKSDWILSELTQFNNSQSLAIRFDTSYKNSGIKFGDNGEFSYWIGRSEGGSGSYQIDGEQAICSVTRYDSGLQDSSTIQLKVVDGVTCLVQQLTPNQFETEPYCVYWSLVDSSNSLTKDIDLTEEFLKGEWIVDIWTDAYNTISLSDLFGSMSNYNIMHFGDNGEFSYYVGADGGSGSYQIVDGQIEYTIADQYSGNPISSSIQLEIIDGKPCLIQNHGEIPMYGMEDTETYYIVWSR